MRLAVISDFREENWPSMDLVTDEFLVHAAALPDLELERIQPRMLAPFSRLARSQARTGVLHNADRVSGRYLEYSLRLLGVRGRYDRYHVVDHSYAHLALLLPGERTGVYCHDIDVFRPLFEPGAATWRRALARTLLAGMQRASVVFYSTESVRAEIEERRLLPRERLVHAPYGVAREFSPQPDAEDEKLRGRAPFVLHVGSLIPRKNPEFLLRLFARLRAARPELEFVQVGGDFGAELERRVAALGLASSLRRLRGITRFELAALYRNTRAVLMPSLAEGFGLPVIEALSCGAPVVSSDLPVLRQVGGAGARYCPVSDLDAWQACVLDVLDVGREALREERLAVAASYSWRAHAETIVRAHERAAGRT